MTEPHPGPTSGPVPVGPADPTWKGAVRGTPSPTWLTIVEQTLHRGFAATPGLDESDRQAFELAAVEICSNQIVHRPPDGGWCSLRLLIADEELFAEFRDDGPAFTLNPEYDMPDVEAEAGRGLALVTMILDDFRHERSGQENQWLLSKRRQQPARVS
jgi:serine/threonine-protein kinase RsbW